MADDSFFDLKTPSEESSAFKTLQAYQKPSTADGFGAAFKSGFRNNISYMAYDFYKSNMGHLNPHDDQMLTAEEANAEFETDMFTGNVRRVDASIRHDRNSTLVEQEAIMRESDISTGTRLLGTLSGGFADPLTALAGVGIGHMAALAGKSLLNAGVAVRFGQLLSASAKTGTTQSLLTQEIAENVVAAAALEIPLAESLENVYDEKVSNAEHAFNIFTGATAGFLLRKAGGAIVRGIDNSLQSRLFQETVARSLNGDSMEGFDDAIAKYKSEFADIAANPNNVSTAYKAVDAPEQATHMAFTTHQVGQPTGMLKSQIKFGSDFGVTGLNLTHNPAVALAKGIDQPNIEVMKFDLSKLNLVDLDLAPDQNLAYIKNFFKFLDDNLPSEAAGIKELPSLKKMLDAVADIAQKNKDDAIQDNVNRIFSAEGIEGYTFTEDFFGKDVGRGAFVFKNTEQVRNSLVGKVDIDPETKTSFQPSRAMETPAEQAKVTPEQADNLARDRQQRGEYQSKDMLYNSDEMGEHYKATFSKDAPVDDLTPARMIEEGSEIADVAREIIEQIEGKQKSDTDSVLDDIMAENRRKKDETPLPASKDPEALAAAAEHTAALRKALELEPKIEETGKMSKSAIVCGQRNK